MEVNDSNRMQMYCMDGRYNIHWGENSIDRCNFSRKVLSGENLYGLNHTTTKSVAGFANATYSL